MNGKPRNLKEYRREAVETEGGRLLLFHVQRAKGFSQVRATQAYGEPVALHMQRVIGTLRRKADWPIAV